MLHRRGKAEALEEAGKGLKKAGSEVVNLIEGKLGTEAKAAPKRGFFTKKMSNGESIASLAYKAALGTVVTVAASAATVWIGKYLFGPNTWLSEDSFRKRKRSLDEEGEDFSETFTSTNESSKVLQKSDNTGDLVAYESAQWLPKDIVKQSHPGLVKRGLANITKRFKSQTIVLGALGLGGMIGGTMIYGKLFPSKTKSGGDTNGAGRGAPSLTHSHYSSTPTAASLPPSIPGQPDGSAGAGSDNSDNDREVPDGRGNVGSPTMYAGEDLTAWPN
ncbi:hypothetical protein FRB95_006003 [Tulasnella sp. JGI-2019a]|nr:hypothetical protein FRB93_011635 [Tulasnella sp. JGI-2019a]KAG9028841.1 hypothetical protein FRB95_006003 [Tulasnella sp. JGI-2019a]